MTHRILALVGALALVATATQGCRTATVESEASRSYYDYTRPLPSRWAIPAGTLMTVRVDQSLSTRTNRPGDRFTTWVVSPLVGPEGDVVVPRGAVITGVLTGVKRSGGPGDQAVLRLDFERIAFDGRSYPVRAEVVDARIGQQRQTGSVGKGAAIGAASGAILGILVGQDLGGMLAGGALGAGAGSLIGLSVSKGDAVLPAGTFMTLRTMNHVDLRDDYR